MGFAKQGSLPVFVGENIPISGRDVDGVSVAHECKDDVGYKAFGLWVYFRASAWTGSVSSLPIAWAR